MIVPNGAGVHARIHSMFPFLVAHGWSYRGFRFFADGDLRALKLRFEKRIRGRLAYAEVEIALAVFNAREFELKEWLLKELAKAEEQMVNRHLQEFAGAA